ncbi:hypothetical protein IWQ51_004156 [Labrenzia sp. EL_142]|nr:hypothetical protein [Labrenzia sp. EL_142]
MKQITKAETLPRIQRDYMVLLVFVLARHGHLDRAIGVIEGLMALGDNELDIRTSRVILLFLHADYSSALEALDQLEASMSSTFVLSEQDQDFRIRRYIRARCYYETGRQQEGKAVAVSLCGEAS